MSVQDPPIWTSHYNHPTPWDQVFVPMTLPQMLDASVARAPDAPFSDFLGARLDYAQFGDLVARFAAGMRALGMEKGDRIGLFLPNVPIYPIAYYGALKAGAIVVNLSPLYSVDELAHQIADSGARIVVTCDVPQLYVSTTALIDRGVIDRIVVGSLSGWMPPVKRMMFRLTRGKQIAHIPAGDARIVDFEKLLRDAPLPMAPVAVAADDIALIQYTGGTTGIPKGAMLTHQNLTANARQIAAIDPEPGAPDRIMGVLPFFHVFANTCVLNRTVLHGGMIAMLPRFDAAMTLKTIQRVKATALPGVPTMYQALLDHPHTARTDFSSLRVCISGGAPLPAEVKTKFEALTGARVVEGYGLTESAGVVSTNPYEGQNKAGTIGQPVPGTRVKLADKEDPTRPPPPGEPGELLFAGPQVMKGYWHHAEADAGMFVGEWLRTGDVGEIDEDGYIRIVDRLKDMIAVGGFKVFPSQIEAVLYRNPAVKEAIVIGVPDRYHGEMPKAFVTLQDGVASDGAALKTWLNPQLGKHERVIEIEVRLNLPKTLVGKLSRKELVAEERAKAAT